MVGFRDVMAEKGALCLLEWPERGEGYIDSPDLEIELKTAEEARTASLSAVSSRSEPILRKMKELK